MPTYEYRCNACAHEFEQFQSMKDKPLRTCPSCGKKQLERLIGIGAAVIFKGSGFYETDYRSDAYKKAADADKPSEKPAENSESKSTSSNQDKNSDKPSQQNNQKSGDNGSDKNQNAVAKTESNHGSTQDKNSERVKEKSSHQAGKGDSPRRSYPQRSNTVSTRKPANPKISKVKSRGSKK